MTDWLRRLYERGWRRLAWCLARSIAALRPGDTELHKLLAEMCANTDDFSAAQTWLQEPLRRDPNDAGVLWMAGMLCLRQNDTARALAYFEPSARLSSGPDIETKAYRLARLDLAKTQQGIAHYRRLDDVLVDTAFWSVMTSDGLVYTADVHGKNLANSPLVQQRVSADENAIIASYPRPTERITEACVLVGGDENYSHWLFRNVLKLVSLDKDGLFLAYPWIVNSDLRPHQSQYLDLLGVSPEKLKTIERGQVIHCDALVVPALLTSKTAIAEGIEWLRKRLMHHLVPQAQANALLYVSRADAAQRHILNERALEEALRELGFTTFVPGRCSVTEQIRAFSSARVIVAVHGAGLTNMLFAPDHAQFVEIVSSALGQMDDFRRIAAARGQAITTLVSQRYGPGQDIHPNADYFVDVEAIVSAARAALSRSARIDT